MAPPYVQRSKLRQNKATPRPKHTRGRQDYLLCTPFSVGYSPGFLATADSRDRSAPVGAGDLSMGFMDTMFDRLPVDNDFPDKFTRRTSTCDGRRARRQRRAKFDAPARNEVGLEY